jgi:conjugal transfer pilus assembly protein TraF
MNKISTFSLTSLVILFQLPLTASWLERKAEGWAWYEEIQKRENQEESLEERDVEIVTHSPTAVETAAQIRKNLEEKLAQAVLEPTEENIAIYMYEQQKWINQSAKFATLWSKVLLQHPTLDATHEFPVSQYGIQLYKQMEQEKRSTLMQKLNSHYGLFFIYEGKSQSSQAFALVVLEFAKKYGWEIIAISRDGILLDGFSDNHPDNGTIQKLGIEHFPSLFLVHPKKGDIRPISYGLASIDRIERNIELQFSNSEEE